MSATGNIDAPDSVMARTEVENGAATVAGERSLLSIALC